MELPDLAARAELVRRYAHLLHHFGSELGERPLVRHTAEFFPDTFTKDEASVTRLVQRLQQHAGLADIPLQVRLQSLDAAEPTASGCGSGACAPAAVGKPGGAPDVARLEEREGGWVLNVFDAEIHHPVALTCTLSRALARLFLAETESETAKPEAPIEASVDVACAALGLGLLVLEGSHIYAKSCGGPSVSQLTALSVGEVAIVCSLFIALGGHSGRRALGELSTTQRALLSEANDWAASNPRLLRELAQSPGQLAFEAPALAETKPWLLRLFDKKPRPEPTLERALAGELGDAELLELARAARGPGGEERAAQAPRDAKRDELRALVEDALRGS